MHYLPKELVQMPLDSEYRLSVVESRVSGQPDLRSGVVRAIPRPSAQEAFAAVRASSGVAEAIAQVPNLAEPATWQEFAFFSVCSKTGSATFLDLWDVDHLDSFSSMQQSVNSCSAWFAGDGFESFGAPPGKTGRVNCHSDQFVDDGHYLAIASLGADPPSSAASVHYILDDFGPGSVPQDLGAFSFTGPVTQPFLLLLSAGAHSFRIDQEQGGFFFNSLTIYQL
jgi:hypothetical protein